MSTHKVVALPGMGSGPTASILGVQVSTLYGLDKKDILGLSILTAPRRQRSEQRHHAPDLVASTRRAAIIKACGTRHEIGIESLFE